MTRGGARPGSGRKPGTVNEQTKRKRELAEAAAAAGITPLELMLSAMRDAHLRGDLDKAHSFARDAAPYVHPRLAATQVTGKDGGPIQTADADVGTPESRKAAIQARCLALGLKDPYG